MFLGGALLIIQNVTRAIIYGSLRPSDGTEKSSNVATSPNQELPFSPSTENGLWERSGKAKTSKN